MKIISYGNVSKEGIELEFDEKISINEGLKLNKWWLSWDKISEILDNGISKCSQCKNKLTSVGEYPCSDCKYGATGTSRFEQIEIVEGI